NNGKMMRPYLVREIRNSATTVLRNEPKVVNNAVCSEQTIQKAKLLMEAVVEEGTAKSIKNKYYKIAGKTGTAQTYVNGKYDEKILRASFCGYFPAENPKYSCIIVMQSALPYDPYRISGGGAAQVFRKIADRIYFNDHELRNELATDSGKVVTLPSVSNGFANDYTVIFNTLGIPQASTPKSNWTNTKLQEASIDYTPLVFDDKTVPNLFGMGMRDAVYIAENAGLTVSCKGYGRLVRQSIPPGTAIRRNETIVLEFN
ncbi:MAG TPA: penicillin-binding transpeptidase domain-containing protein, partial [Bacteroidales bacterium]|nr:penicillin-binding transpeptidase domain-containing protein [Bacteroidales bacterium]